MKPYFKIALNLPHAGRVARRILPLLPSSHQHADAAAAQRVTLSLIELLDPWLEADENPPPAESASIRDQAAARGRVLVDLIERGKFGHDRLGQCVRNFFECLELGLEGADLSLRAGEDPRSLQRPF